VDDVVAPIAACGVVIDGKYKGVDGKPYKSPIRGAKKDDEVMEDVGNYANDDIAAGESPKVADGSTYVTANASTKPANGVDSYTKHAGTTPSGTEHENGKNGSNEAAMERVSNRDGLSLIATQIGKPIMLDAFTSLMCEDSWGRINFARALVEISVGHI
ncbi:hypothetical protein Tco_0849675, partial [Tanacetum coccineum]